MDQRSTGMARAILKSNKYSGPWSFPALLHLIYRHGDVYCKQMHCCCVCDVCPGISQLFLTFAFGPWQVGEIKAHAAEWKANVTAEFRETRRRLSVEIHDKLQRAATIRSMERRRLGLDQRAHSLDMLSPEKRCVFAALDSGHFKASSQESINKPNNLRLKGTEQLSKHGQGASEDNIINKFGSSSKLTKRKNKDLKKSIPEDVRKIYETFRNYSLDEEKKEEDSEKVCNSEHSSTAILTNCIEQHRDLENGMIPIETKEREHEIKSLLEDRN